ncbi:MAG TPA: SIS domain-containing protein [Polyangiaceae bacterium]
MIQEGILRKARESAELSLSFFESQASALEACVRALAERFERGGRLLTMGNGGSACDARHVAVEFSHPIVEKRRALPAYALGDSVALISAIGNDGDFSRVFVEEIELLARPHDALLGISSSGASSNVNRGLRRGRELGLLTIGFSGRDGGAMTALCDHAFVVPSWSTHRIQEVHTTLLHLLWDSLHVVQGEQDVL